MNETQTPPTSGGRAGSGLETLTGWVLAHKRWVAGFWIVMTIAGFWGAGQVTNALDDEFTMPDSEAFATNQEIEEQFGSGGDRSPLVAVAQLPEGTTVEDPGVRGDLQALERELAAALPGSRVASYGSTGEPGYVSDDGRTTFAIAHPKIDPELGGPGGDIAPETLAAARDVTESASVGGAQVMLTGEAALSEEPAESGGGTEFLSETLIAGVAALAVLAFVFASALALVPLNSTARPDVATAARTASSLDIPRSRSSRQRMTTISA